MWDAFANVKATHILSAKILAYMPYLMIKVLTICKLMTLLVSNNWTQIHTSASKGVSTQKFLSVHTVHHLT